MISQSNCFILSCSSTWSMYLPFPKSFRGFLLPVFVLSIRFSPEARCWLSFWSAFFSGCKDSVTRLHLHFYHCLLNLNNLSCSSQLPSPLVLQNQSEALAFVIKLILEAPAISHGLLTPSLFCWVEVLGEDSFFFLNWLIYLRFVRDFIVRVHFQRV